jgi:Ca2+-transporting ATPase
MIDPPRTEVKPALEHARHAGIRTVMITGDFPNTAKAIAEAIGLLRPGKNVLTGAALDDMNDEELKNVIEDTDVFARVSPEHKMRIVDALQANDEIVAMTGDGVNDAPAIKRADIGVAMGITGTDVAKETADMVLTDDNYASIVAAVEQGRVIYSNIRKFVFFLLSSNVAEIMIIFLATLAGPPPLTAIQPYGSISLNGAPASACHGKGDQTSWIKSRVPNLSRESLNGHRHKYSDHCKTSRSLGCFCYGLVWHLDAGSFSRLARTCCPSSSRMIGAEWTFKLLRRWLSSRCRLPSCSALTPCARSALHCFRLASSRINTCNMRLEFPLPCC